MHPVKSFKIFGEQVDILLSGQQTDNTCTVLIQTSPPGGGPPPHVQDREDETFQALEGEFELLLDGQWMPLPLGQSRFVPRGVPHTFRNAGQTPGKMLVFVAPAGLDTYLETVGHLSPTTDLPEIVRISEQYGIRFLL